MADVFLSYARSTAAAANRIAVALRKNGYDVWFDKDLPAHRSYSDVIAAELERSAAVVVLWSRDAVQSQWVRSEANRARETGRLVQARLDDARLPMPFDQVQCADLRGGIGVKRPEWQAVLRSIADLVGTDAPGASKSASDVVQDTDRRGLMIAGGAVALAATGLVGWRLANGDESPPEARLLLQKGLDALQSNDAFDSSDAGTTLQAIALLNQATAADPRSSAAWGALALAYAVRVRASPLADRAGLESRSRSAARKALDLDRKEPRALAALRLLDPVYRNWAAAERDGLNALRAHPRHPILIFTLSDVLGSVGKWRQASELSARFDRSRFLIPGADRKRIINLWCAGDLQGADEALDVALDHWPDHAQLWRTRIAYLMFSGRAAEVVPLLRDDGSRPAGIDRSLLETMRATAEALAGKAEPSAAIRANLDYARAVPTAALQAAQAVAALGGGITALAMLEGYYFGRGEWSPLAPLGGDDERQTSPLFQPPMRSLWTSADFNRLLERIGLNAYWRQSRTNPDFRRE